MELDERAKELAFKDGRLALGLLLTSQEQLEGGTVLNLLREKCVCGGDSKTGFVDGGLEGAGRANRPP